MARTVILAEMLVVNSVIPAERSAVHLRGCAVRPSCRRARERLEAQNADERPGSESSQRSCKHRRLSAQLERPEGSIKLCIDILTRQIYLKGLDFDDRLMGLAFLDVNMYVADIKVFKNLLLISDAVKSMWFASIQVSHINHSHNNADYQDEPYKFTTISKDLRDIASMTGDFLIHDGQMTFVLTDRDGVLRLLDFDPGGELIHDSISRKVLRSDPESINGEKMILKTEYYFGSPVLASRMVARHRTAEEEYAPQTQLILGTWSFCLMTRGSCRRNIGWRSRFPRQRETGTIRSTAAGIRATHPKRAAYRGSQSSSFPVRRDPLRLCS